MASSPTASEPAAALPGLPPGLALVLDLDGTLTPVDTLHETLLQFRRAPPAAVTAACAALFAGRAVFKRALARFAQPDPDLLPLRQDLLAWLERQHAAGRPILLISAADQSLVEKIAARLPFPVAGAIGSDGVANLKGEAKLARIRALLGDDFAYAGDSQADLPIFRAAKAVILAGRMTARLAAALGPVPVLARFPDPPLDLASLARTLRLQQWVKNLLLFLPLLLAGPLATPWEWLVAGLSFLMLGCLASAGYVVNDLLDLEADRRHRLKRRRPFASGAVPVAVGAALIPALLLAAALIAAFLPFESTIAATAYLAGTLGYSLAFKKKPVLDVLLIAGLFTIRVVLGIVVLGEPWSFWMLTFSMFFFFSLALVKRYAELFELVRRAGKDLPRRGYTEADLPLLLSLGTSAAIGAAVIFVVYLVQEEFSRALYRSPGWLWLVFPLLLYWICRIWQKAVQGRMLEDPLLFAFRDRVSYGIGLAVVVLILLARHV